MTFISDLHEGKKIQSVHFNIMVLANASGTATYAWKFTTINAQFVLNTVTAFTSGAAAPRIKIKLKRAGSTIAFLMSQTAAAAFTGYIKQPDIVIESYDEVEFEVTSATEADEFYCSLNGYEVMYR